MLRVLVVDDRALIRAAASPLFDYEEYFQFVHRCADWDEATSWLSDNHVNWVVRDFQFERGNALSFIESQVSQNANSRILFSSGHHTPVFENLCDATGAAGFVIKGCSPEDLLESRTQSHRDPSRDRDQTGIASRLGSTGSAARRGLFR